FGAAEKVAMHPIGFEAGAFAARIAGAGADDAARPLRHGNQHRDGAVRGERFGRGDAHALADAEIAQALLGAPDRLRMVEATILEAGAATDEARLDTLG